MPRGGIHYICKKKQTRSFRAKQRKISQHYEPQP